MATITPKEKAIEQEEVEPEVETDIEEPEQDSKEESEENLNELDELSPDELEKVRGGASISPEEIEKEIKEAMVEAKKEVEEELEPEEIEEPEEGFVKSTWNKVKDFFRSIPQRIQGIVEKIKSGVKKLSERMQPTMLDKANDDRDLYDEEEVQRQVSENVKDIMEENEAEKSLRDRINVKEDPETQARLAEAEARVKNAEKQRNVEAIKNDVEEHEAEQADEDDDRWLKELLEDLYRDSNDQER